MLLIMSALFLTQDNRILIVPAALTIALIRSSGVPLRVFGRPFVQMAWFLAITFFIPLFFISGETLISLGPVNVSRQGLIQGTIVTLRLAAALGLTSLLTFTTAPIALSEGLEGILAPLSKIGLPAHEVAMMMSMALRFLPTLLEEAHRIINAQKARGGKFNQRNPLARVRALLSILVPLLLSVFRRADQLALAMEARCYRGAQGRTKMRPLQWAARDTLTVIAAALIAAVSITCSTLLRYWSG